MTKQLIALVSLFSSNCNTSDVGAIDMRVFKDMIARTGRNMFTVLKCFGKVTWVVAYKDKKTYFIHFALFKDKHFHSLWASSGQNCQKHKQLGQEITKQVLYNIQMLEKTCS